MAATGTTARPSGAKEVVCLFGAIALAALGVTLYQAVRNDDTTTTSFESRPAPGNAAVRTIPHIVSRM